MRVREVTLALPARLEGRRLQIARGLWLLVVITATALAAAGLSKAFQRPDLITPEAAMEVVGAGSLTLRRLIVGAVCVPLFGAAVVSGVIFWRRSHDPMALLFSAALVLLFAVSSRGLLAFASHPVLRLAIPVVSGLAMLCLALVLALFPNGRFVPRWTAWLAPAMVALMVASPATGEVVMRMPDVPRDMALWPTGVLVVGWSAIMLVGLAAQVHRYRRVSDGIERLQTKWVMAPLGVLFAFIVVVVILPAFFLGASSSWVGWGIFAAVSFGVVVPVMLANAVLRYRLYAIDQVISRTVTYTLVVALLAGVYATTVVVLGWIVSSIAPQQESNLVVAASTLAAAGLFGPLRRHVQRRVDRRFNRTAYDARRSAEGFSHSLRDEVDLGEISHRLTTVTRRTLQPRQVAVFFVDAAASPARPGAGTEQPWS